jgi:hypothetical protein
VKFVGGQSGARIDFSNFCKVLLSGTFHQRSILAFAVIHVYQKDKRANKANALEDM